MEPWKNPTLTLGERSVLFAENEMKLGVKEDSPGSFSSKRIREYFSICTRLMNGIETPITLSKGNWCCASVSFCMKQSLLLKEKQPHGYRVGVVEVVTDMQKTGNYFTVKNLLENKYSPKIGDLIIFDRSQPGKQETSWYRHIGRFYSINNDSFECISGNSNGKWRITKHSFDQTNLLGFGQYPSVDSIPNLESQGLDWSHVDISCLAPCDDSGKDLSSDNFYTIYHKIFKN